MTRERRHRFVRAWLPLLLIMTSGGVLSCGEGAPASTSTGETPGVRELAGVLEMPTVVDSDGDGLPDEIDADPDAEPAIAGSLGSGAFTIDRVVSLFGEGEIEGVCQQDVEVVLEGRGLDRLGGDAWVVFKTGEGDRAVEPTRLDGEHWRVVAPRDVRALFAVVGRVRTAMHHVEPLPGDRPRVQAPGAPVQAGTTLELQGARLDEVTEARLGGEAIVIARQTASAITVEIPSAPLGDTLRLVSGAGRSNAVVLDLRREVRLVVDASLALPPGVELVAHHARQAHVVSIAEEPVLEVAAHRPAIFLLDLVRADGGVEYGAVAAVAWPDQAEAMASAESTLVAALVQMRRRTLIPVHADWLELRERLEATFDSPVAQTFLADFDHWLGTEELFDRLGLVRDLITFRLGTDDPAGMPTAAQAAQAAFGDPAAASSFLTDWYELFTQGSGPTITSFGGYLDDVLAFTASPYDGDRPQLSQNTTIPDVELVGGNAYSQFEVAKHAERRFVAADGSLGSTICRYPPGTNAPAGIRPSDLCVQNSTIVHASFAVYRPNGALGGSYTPSSSDLVRSHIEEILDPAAIKNEGIYLTANRKLPTGEPLCRMRTCYVEVLTGGLGLGLDVKLEPTDEKIVEKLRTRSIYENILEIAVAQIADLSDPNQVPSCVANLVYKDSKFYDEILKFGAALSTKSEAQLTTVVVLDEFMKTVGGFLEGLVTGASGESTIFSCLADNRPELEVEKAIKAKLKAPSPIAGLSQFKYILDSVMMAGGVLLTPEKFVFKTTHRAEILKVRVSGGSSSEPVEIDTVRGLFTDEEQSVPANIIIEGTWLANNPIDDLDRRWHPTIRVTDRRGAHREQQLSALHVEPTGDLSHRKLVVPVAALASLLDELTAGPVTLSLRYDQASFDVDSVFAGYPAQTLSLPSPVPITLANQPKIEGFEPLAGRLGGEIAIVGSGLGHFSSEIPATVSLTNIADPDTYLELPASALLSNTDTELRIKLPDDLQIDAAYTVTIQSHDGVGFVVSPGQFLVIDGSTPTITFGDVGLKKDDSLALRLLDMNGNLQREARVPDDGRWVRSFSIDNAARQAQGDPPILRFEIECIDPGNDTDCTYGVSVDNATMDRLSTGGNDGLVTDGDKIKQGTQNRAGYGLDPL